MRTSGEWALERNGDRQASLVTCGTVRDWTDGETDISPTIYRPDTRRAGRYDTWYSDAYRTRYIVSRYDAICITKYYYLWHANHAGRRPYSFTWSTIIKELLLLLFYNLESVSSPINHSSFRLSDWMSHIIVKGQQTSRFVIWNDDNVDNVNFTCCFSHWMGIYNERFFDTGCWNSQERVSFSISATSGHQQFYRKTRVSVQVSTFSTITEYIETKAIHKL